jgi:preprotein translocase subunit SecA
MESSESTPTMAEFPRQEGRPAKRFNALGILEDIPPEDLELVDAIDQEDDVAEHEADENGTAVPARPVMRGSPVVVGAGPVRSLQVGGGALPPGWESTPRNNACPCGSCKKFKKCHGVNL